MEVESSSPRLATYDASWPERFEQEARLIAQALGELVIEIEHVGSTAVPGLVAKPTIDIAVGVTRLEFGDEALRRMAEAGYEDVGDDVIPGQRIFRKGARFPRAAIVHVVEWGSPHWRNHLGFRDVLRREHEKAQEYADLKHRLLEERGAWYSGKDKQTFVVAVLERAPKRTFTVSCSPEETELRAGELGRELEPGDVVTVAGELGAGKTTFVRGACRALGVDRPVTSPTFTIGHRYEGRVSVSHLDLYRFTNLSHAEWGDLEPYFDEAVAFVEWPEAAAGVLPPVRARVRMRHIDRDRRAITIERADPRV